MGKEIAEVEMKGFALRSATAVLGDVDRPKGAGVGVGVLQTSAGPRVLLVLHDADGNAVTGMLDQHEFLNFATLMEEAGTRCATGAAGAAVGSALQ